MKNGIISTAKHFAGHAQSEGGRNCSPVHMGMRELRDFVLFPFEAAVREAGVKAIMNAYHDIDGVPCAASRELLTGILRDEWGFDGIVVSDYFAIERLISHHAVAADKKEAAKQALEAGIDMEFPNADCYGEVLIQAVREGYIDEALVDRAVERLLKMKVLLGLLDSTAVSSKTDPMVKPIRLFHDPANKDMAREMAQKSMVMLKNEGGILPLKLEKLSSIAVIGPCAASRRNLLGSYSYASINSHFGDGTENEVEVAGFIGREIVSVLEGIQAKVANKALDKMVQIRYAQGCDLFSGSRDYFDEEVNAAKHSDVAVVVVGDRPGMFAGGTSGENIDRVDNRLFGIQEELVETICAAGTPVALILINGRPLSVKRPSNTAQAVIEAWLPGEQGGNAVADVLFGDYNPGGKLSVSLPDSIGQQPLPYHVRPVTFHKKYLESEVKPLYPFGYGLSYTDFGYSGLTISQDTDGCCGEIRIGVYIENTGHLAGEEVAQLYIRDAVASVTRPVKELKGFKRLRLEPGEQRSVEYLLHTDQLAFHNREMKPVVEPGEFKVMIGSSSEDIRLEGRFELTGPVYEMSRERRVYFSRVIVI